MIHSCSEPPAATHSECTEDGAGIDYQGKMNHTKSAEVGQVPLIFFFNFFSTLNNSLWYLAFLKMSYF